MFDSALVRRQVTGKRWPFITSRSAAYALAMPGTDPLDDLGLKACPNCLEQMQPAGSARELLVADVTVVTGSAYWECPACGLTVVP